MPDQTIILNQARGWLEDYDAGFASDVERDESHRAARDLIGELIAADDRSPAGHGGHEIDIANLFEWIDALQRQVDRLARLAEARS